MKVTAYYGLKTPPYELVSQAHQLNNVHYFATKVPCFRASFLHIFVPGDEHHSFNLSIFFGIITFQLQYNKQPLEGKNGISFLPIEFQCQSFDGPGCLGLSFFRSKHVKYLQGRVVKTSFLFSIIYLPLQSTIFSQVLYHPLHKIEIVLFHNSVFTLAVFFLNRRSGSSVSSVMSIITYNGNSMRHI